MTQPDPATPEKTVKRWTVCAVCGGSTSVGHIHGQFSDGAAELIEVVPLSLLFKALEAIDQFAVSDERDNGSATPTWIQARRRRDKLLAVARSIRAEIQES